tara:strand:- start:2363 stop:2737 length:375 start_codon:yes stop_codon:yes gene_type:complete
MTMQEQRDHFLKVVKILSSWGVDPSRMARIILMNEGSLDRLSAITQSSVRLTEDQLRRIDLVVNFARIINGMFENPSNVTYFASRPNDNYGFDGRSLLEILEHCDTDDLQRVYRNFYAEMINPW